MVYCHSKSLSIFMLIYLLKISFRDGLHRATVLTALVTLLLISGCGDFFEKKTTELQTREILQELGQPREVTSIKNPMPDLYRGEPRKVTVPDGVKLFYFTKQHDVAHLAELVTQQLGNKVSSSAATNQLIVHCGNDENANTVLEFLEQVDVPPIQVNIDCLVVERFADVTLDWETTIEIQNLLGEEITFGATKDGPAFPGAALREGARREFGLDFGLIRGTDDGHLFKAIVDVLESRGYLKILMNPQLETVNGQIAKIVSRENVPLQKIIFKAGLDEPFETTEYQWVEDTLEVTPYVYADGSIGLKTHVQIGSKSKPEGVIQVSVITERTIDVQENRIKPGDSLVIGGLRKSEKRSVIRGVPFFKDIPVVGVLFSSKDFEEKATEIIFILTPSISSGGRPYEEIVDEVREMHKTPKYESGLEETLTDPFGSAKYREQVKELAEQAEIDRRKAELKKAEAMVEVEQMKKELIESTEEVIAEKARAARSLSQAKQAQKEAVEAQKAAQKAKAQAEETKDAFLKAQAEAAAARAAAEAAQAEAEAQKKAAQAAKAQAEAAKAQADEAERARQQKEAQDKQDQQKSDEDTTDANSTS